MWGRCISLLSELGIIWRTFSTTTRKAEQCPDPSLGCPDKRTAGFVPRVRFLESPNTPKLIVLPENNRRSDYSLKVSHSNRWTRLVTKFVSPVRRGLTISVSTAIRLWCWCRLSDWFVRRCCRILVATESLPQPTKNWPLYICRRLDQNRR